MSEETVSSKAKQAGTQSAKKEKLICLQATCKQKAARFGYCERHFQSLIDSFGKNQSEPYVGVGTHDGDTDEEKLVIAAYYGNLPELKKLVIEKKVNVNSQVGGLAESALMRAASNGNTEVARFLVENKAQVDLPNKIGYPASLYCVKHKKLDTLQYLIDKAGANVNLRVPEGFTMVQLAVKWGCGPVCAYLISRGAKFDSQSAPTTPDQKGDKRISLFSSLLPRTVGPTSPPPPVATTPILRTSSGRLIFNHPEPIGWLKKRSQNKLIWQRRLFKFIKAREHSRARLVYYKTEQERSSGLEAGIIYIGEIKKVSSVTATPGVPEAEAAKQFELESVTRVYTLAAETFDECQTWMSFLQKAITSSATSPPPKEKSTKSPEVADPVAPKATSPGHRGPVLVSAMEGWLKKKATVNRHMWQRRYFVFDIEDQRVPRLVYFKNDRDRKAGAHISGAIPCHQIQDVDQASSGRGSDQGLRFNLTIPGRVFALMAENQIECEKWVAVLSLHIKAPRPSVAPSPSISLSVPPSSSSSLSVSPTGSKIATPISTVSTTTASTAITTTSGVPQLPSSLPPELPSTLPPSLDGEGGEKLPEDGSVMEGEIKLIIPDVYTITDKKDEDYGEEEEEEDEEEEDEEEEDAPSADTLPKPRGQPSKTHMAEVHYDEMEIGVMDVNELDWGDEGPPAVFQTKGVEDS